MKEHVSRRTVLRGIGAGTITLTAVGPVSAAGETRFLVTANGRGARKRIERAGFDVERALAGGEVLYVTGSAGDRSALESVRGVGNVVQDFEVAFERPESIESTAESTDDSLFPLQWDKQDITTDAAIAHDTATGAGTKLAIIDTGTEFDHPDLAGNSRPGEGRLFRTLDVKGRDLPFVRGERGPVELPVDFLDLSKGTKVVTRHVANDAQGHGTHVAGIAAASDAGTTGVVGTAPDADVVPLRVFYWTEDSDGNAALSATFGDILAAIDYASVIGCDALNMSLGTPPLPPQVNAGGIRGVMERVINTAVRRGTVVVNAAGNDATDLGGGLVMYPSSISGALSISATGPNDELVFYSNYGTSEITVGAPGGGYETLKKTLCKKDGTIAGCDPAKNDCDCDPPEWPFPTNLVLSTIDPDTLYGQALGDTDDDGDVEETVTYGYLAGTSMATPQVTGTVGLVREVAPNANARTVEKAIEQGAELVPGEGSDELGAGRLNAVGALNAPVLGGRGGRRGP